MVSTSSDLENLQLERFDEGHFSWFVDTLLNLFVDAELVVGVATPSPQLVLLIDSKGEVVSDRDLLEGCALLEIERSEDLRFFNALTVLGLCALAKETLFTDTC